MPNDSPGSNAPTPQDRLLDLTERFATETTKITTYFEATKQLLEKMDVCNADLKKKIGDMNLHQQNLTNQVTNLRGHCRDVWAEVRRKPGIVGILDWAIEKAQSKPLAFALVFMTLVVLMAILALLGWDLSALLTK
jgi:hypothetical protein